MSPSPSVLITGAGRGLGLAMTKAFLGANWLVFPLVRRDEDADREPHEAAE